MQELNHSEYNNSLFKKLVSFYDWVAVFLYTLRRDMVKEVGFGPNLKVIDLACGTGTQAIKLAQNGHAVIGIDISPDMIGFAKRKNMGASNPVFQIGNATKTDYLDSYFDISIISFALHDMPDSMRQEIIKEAKRITRLSGKIIIADYRMRSNQIMRRLMYWLTKIWESRYYDDFLDKGLDYYLQKENMPIETRKSYLWGELEMVVTSNH